MNKPTLVPTSTHWGNFRVETGADGLVAIHPAERDTDPSPIGQSLLAAQDEGCRIPRPCVRKGYLDKRWRSDGSKRGVEPFVAVPWDEALDLAAEALKRVVDQHGNEAIYRRFLRLGERRAVPSRSEPAAPLPEPARRLHLLGAVVLHRHRQGHHPSGARHAGPRCDEPAADHQRRARAHPPGGQLRRDQHEEHPDEPGWHRRPLRARSDEELAGRRDRGDLHQPAA